MKKELATHKISQEIFALVDQGTWSMLSLLATAFYIQNNALSDVGKFSLVLAFTYCNLSILRTYLMFPIISESVMLNVENSRDFSKKIFKPLMKILFVELLIFGMILQINLQDARQVVDFIIIVIALTSRDISRSINIYFDRCAKNILQNTIGILTLTLFVVAKPISLTILEIWTLALLVTFVPIPIDRKHLVSRTIQNRSSRPLTFKQTKLLRFDSLILQLMNVLTLALFTKLDSTLVGKYMIAYTCIASVAMTVGSGITGKLHLQYLREQTKEVEIFKRYLITILILLINSCLMLSVDFLPELLVGTNWDAANEVFFPTLLLCLTVILVQFYAFPLLANTSMIHFIVFRILSFFGINILPYLFMILFSLGLTLFCQIIFFFTILIFARRSVRV